MMGLGSDVANVIERFKPDTNYRKEATFRDGLADYLQAALSGGMMGQTPTVRTEGVANVDIAVNGSVGIECKHTPTAGEVDRLSGQIGRYQREYDHVICTTFGEPHDRWHELRRDYERQALHASPVELIHVRRPSKQTQQRQSDAFGGLF